MELYPLQVFLTVATEKSFSRAAEKLLRTQPAVSLALQRLEQELGEKLIDRSGKDLLLTDAGRTVLDYARRFENLEQELENALAELRDNSAGRLTIGANESTTLYLLRHIERYREMYPKIKVQVRRSLSSKIPGELLNGNLELGVISYDPGDERIRLQGDLHRRAGVYRFAATPAGAPQGGLHRRAAARRRSSRITWSRPIAKWCCASSRRTRSRCAWMWRCPPSRPSANWCRTITAWPSCRACAWSRRSSKRLVCEVRIKEMHVERKIRLVYPVRRALSHAARAFLDVVGG